MIEVVRAHPPFTSDAIRLPDGRFWRLAIGTVLDYRVVGDRVLVKLAAIPGRTTYAAVALDKKRFLHQNSAFAGNANAAVPMIADVKDGTDIDISEENVAAFVSPTGRLCSVGSIPFSVLEVYDGFLVMLHFTRPKEHPGNLFYLDRAGNEQWRLTSASNSMPRWFSSMRLDSDGSVLLGYDLKMPDCWRLELPNGQLTRTNE